MFDTEIQKLFKKLKFLPRPTTPSFIIKAYYLELIFTELHKFVNYYETENAEVSSLIFLQKLFEKPNFLPTPTTPGFIIEVHYSEFIMNLYDEHPHIVTESSHFKRACGASSSLLFLLSYDLSSEQLK